MPTPYIKKLANIHNTSVGKSEGRWENAKQQAAKQGHGEDFAYITGIYKKMMGEDVSEMSLKQFLKITEMDDVSDIGYGSPTDEEPCDDEFCDDELDLDLEDDLEGEEGHELADVLSPEELDDEEGEFGDEEFPEDEFGDEEFPEDEFGDEEFPEDEFEVREGTGQTAKAKLIHQVNKSSKKLAKVRKNSGFDDLPKGQAKEQKRVIKGLNNTGVKNLTTKVYKEDEDLMSPMSFLNELMMLDEGNKPKKKSLKKAAKSVYHRDYVKTKNKPYRKYDPSERGND
ncbi:MAG: hypothetical protein CTY12_07905 [Methylotenera sp.]|nr:MAG: hypothetical protein CTY12_07905 [Methylotenera sp.]